MANTTFNGAVRSENGFQVISKAANTGVETTNLTISASGGIANPTGVVGSTLTAKTQLANGFSGALAKNTHYLAPADGNNATATLPTAATSTVGDTIIVEYQAAMSTSQTHKYGTSGEFFMAGSAVYRRSGVEIFSVDTADGAGDDFLNLIGLTNAGPGIGSYVVFTYNGSKWRAEARLASSGTGAALNLSVFATS
jgi:hypothetical protein